MVGRDLYQGGIEPAHYAFDMDEYPNARVI
jgi:hypothetical protein